MGTLVEVAVLLVAGVGSRLKPLTDDRPKALVPVGDETILARAVRLLAEAGVREIVLATGYREDAVRRALACAPVPTTYCPNPEYATTQNAVSLFRCADAVGGRSFFKLDGDVLFHPDVLARLAVARGALAVAVDRRADLGDEEMKVEVDVASGRITAFGKGLDPKTAAGESIGIERIAASAASRVFAALGEAVGRGEVGLYYEDVYARLVRDGLAATAVDVSDLPWTEVDTPDDLARARDLVASRRLDPTA